MRFQILSHAGMIVEENNISILFDPWLIGSCYWRSWWNFPEPDSSLVNTLKPNYIYLTHLHWDHFHGPSLKLFNPNTKFIVPKIQSKRMIKDLNELGFENITEIAHGSKIVLGDQFELYSYQFGPCADSAAVIKTPNVTLLNANDSKLFGFPLAQIINKFKSFDFVFRSHSSATAIPYCIQGYHEDYNDLRTRKDYIEDFTAFSLFLKAKYAIPFASNHCFLHKETLEFNGLAVSPLEVQNYYNKKSKLLGFPSECVLMAPGSSWDEQRGFEIKSFDYNQRQNYIKALQHKYSQKLDNCYAQESRALANWAYFKSYFDSFFKALPGFIFKRKNVKVVFEINDSKGPHYWTLDLSKKLVYVQDDQEQYTIKIASNPRIINDCVRKKMFSVWTASKRLKIHLANKKDLLSLQLFFTVLDLYELDILPIRKNFTLRAVGIYLRRWREILEFLRVFFRIKILKQSFTLSTYYPLKNRSHLKASMKLDELS